MGTFHRSFKTDFLMVSLLRFGTVCEQMCETCNITAAVIVFVLGQVHDRRGEKFPLRRPSKKFPGEGQAVHGDEPGLC